MRCKLRCVLRYVLRCVLRYVLRCILRCALDLASTSLATVCHTGRSCLRAVSHCLHRLVPFLFQPSQHSRGTGRGSRRTTTLHGWYMVGGAWDSAPCFACDLYSCPLTSDCHGHRHVAPLQPIGTRAVARVSFYHSCSSQGARKQTRMRVCRALSSRYCFCSRQLGVVAGVNLQHPAGSKWCCPAVTLLCQHSFLRFAKAGRNTPVFILEGQLSTWTRRLSQQCSSSRVSSCSRVIAMKHFTG